MGRIIAENKHTGKLYPVDSKAIYRVIYEVVAVLPTENIKTSVIYCVPIIGKENEYDMFLYIDSDWVSIGSDSIDLSDKMDLAPLNPTAEQIAALPAGQLYSDTASHKGVIKGGQAFYDTIYIDQMVITSSALPIEYSESEFLYKKGAIYICGRYIFNLERIDAPVHPDEDYHYIWQRPNSVEYYTGTPIDFENRYNKRICFFQIGDIYIRENFSGQIEKIYRCASVTNDDNYFYYGWEQIVYTKNEIDQKGYLTLETLPIYDGTVI